MLFIVAMRHVGTSRFGAYFSIAPFFGAVLAVILDTPIVLIPMIAALLTALGVWLHLTERHEHEATDLTLRANPRGRELRRVRPAGG